jgi:hypothetical protein
MSAGAPLVSCSVSATTPSTVGDTVLCALVSGSCTRQSEQVAPELACHVGSAPEPLETSTSPVPPVPMFWKAPVLVVPPATRPYAVVDETPVPPCGTPTAVNPVPSDPEVSAPTPVMLPKEPLARSPLPMSDEDTTPALEMWAMPIPSAEMVSDPPVMVASPPTVRPVSVPTPVMLP